MNRAWLAIVRNPWMILTLLCLVAGYILGIISGNSRFLSWSGLLTMISLLCLLLHKKTYRRVFADLHRPRFIASSLAICVGYLAIYTKYSGYFAVWGFLLVAGGFIYLQILRNRAEISTPTKGDNAKGPSALNHIQR